MIKDLIEKLEKIQKLTFDEARSGDVRMATINDLAHECKRIIINNNLTVEV